MAFYSYLGCERKEYKDRSGVDRVGYDVFLCEKKDTGYRPLLVYDNNRKVYKLPFMSEDRFVELGFDKLDYPADIEDILYDRYGRIRKIVLE